MSNEQPLTRKDVEERLTAANAVKPFEEFPKSLYHPDGTTIIVTSRADQDARGEQYFERPQEAIDEKKKRDKRDSDAFIAKANAEAKASAAKKG